MPAWARLLTVPSGDPHDLRHLFGRALAEVRELEDRALTLWQARHRLARSPEEVAHLGAPLGPSLVGRLRDLRLGGQLPRFEGSTTEKVDREAPGDEQHPGVQGRSLGDRTSRPCATP